RRRHPALPPLPRDRPARRHRSKRGPLDPDGHGRGPPAGLTRWPRRRRALYTRGDMSDPSAAEDRAWTLESWGALPEDHPGELVDGRLQEEEVPTRIHEAALMWILFALRAWGRPRGAKVYGSELKLAITDRRGRKPDGSVFLKGTPRSD